MIRLGLGIFQRGREPYAHARIGKIAAKHLSQGRAGAAHKIGVRVGPRDGLAGLAGVAAAGEHLQGGKQAVGNAGSLHFRQRLFLKRQGRFGSDLVDRRNRSHGGFLPRGFIELPRDVAISPLVFHIVGRHRKIPVAVEDVGHRRHQAHLESAVRVGRAPSRRPDKASIDAFAKTLQQIVADRHAEARGGSRIQNVGGRGFIQVGPRV